MMMETKSAVAGFVVEDGASSSSSSTSPSDAERFLPLRNADTGELFLFDCVNACLLKKDDEHVQRSVFFVVDEAAPLEIETKTSNEESEDRKIKADAEEKKYFRPEEAADEEEEEAAVTVDWSAEHSVDTSRVAAEAIEASYAALCEARSEVVAELDMCQEKFAFLAAALRDQERALRAYVSSKRETYRRMTDLCLDCSSHQGAPLSPILDAIVPISSDQPWENARLAIGACERRQKQVAQAIEPVLKGARTAEESFLSARHKFFQILARHEREAAATTTSIESRQSVRHCPPSPHPLEMSSPHVDRLARYARRLASAHEAHQRALERFLNAAHASTKDCWLELTPILLALLELDATATSFDPSQHSEMLQKALDTAAAHPTLSDRIQQVLACNTSSATRPISSSSSSTVTTNTFDDAELISKQSSEPLVSEFSDKSAFVSRRYTPRIRLHGADDENNITIQSSTAAHQEIINVCIHPESSPTLSSTGKKTVHSSTNKIDDNTMVILAATSDDDEAIEDEDTV